MTVEEIRELRIAESEHIKNMSVEEFVKYSNNKCSDFTKLVLENQKRKEIMKK